MILWLLLCHFNDCNEKRTRYLAANSVLCHNIIILNVLFGGFCLIKWTKRTFLDKYNFLAYIYKPKLIFLEFLHLKTV